MEDHHEGHAVFIVIHSMGNHSQSGLEGEALDNQRDMADELFDGNIASEMALGEATVRNILLPPAYVTSIYSYQKELEKYQQRLDRIRNRGIREAHHGK